MPSDLYSAISWCLWRRSSSTAPGRAQQEGAEVLPLLPWVSVTRRKSWPSEAQGCCCAALPALSSCPAWLSHLDGDRTVDVLPVEDHLHVEDGVGGAVLHRGAPALVVTLDEHIGICSWNTISSTALGTQDGS